MRALLIYYSFTGQAQRAVALASEELRAQQVEPLCVRIEFAHAGARLRRPLPFKEQVLWGNLAERRQTVPVTLDPPELPVVDIDFIVLFSNTWKFHPSVPVQSFLATPEAARLLHGRPFAVVVVCRGFWRKNLRIVRALAEGLGGHYLAGDGFGFAGGWLSSTVQSVRYVASAGAAERRWGLLPLPPFGLSPRAQERLRGFVRGLPDALRALRAGAR